MDKTQFFYRTAIFTRKAGKVALADINNPADTTELQEWLGIVVSLADGQHSIQDLIDYMLSQYQQPPERLEETLDSVIERLLEGKMIQLSDKSVELPYYLASPIEQLDIEKAKKLMKEDGCTI